MSEERTYRPPVSWLGGRDLLANLKYFLLFASFKGKLDPRDWMKAEVFPLGENQDSQYFETFTEDGIDGEKEFWFDYFADAGDGMKAAYNLSCLAISNLFVNLPKNWSSLRPAERRRYLDAPKPEDQEHRPSAVHFKRQNQTPATQEVHTLRRGAFLFIGGDTTYHVADYGSLGERFQKGFEWAFTDLKEAKLATDEMWKEPNRRPLFGIPGNHDYYDMLDGFNRQFRRAITDENDYLDFPNRILEPQLRVWVFKRFQTASYMAIKLPFEWWFWGVDSQPGSVDLRQQEFFTSCYAKYRSAGSDQSTKRTTPEKLIIATAEPTTVNGTRASLDTAASKTFSLLNLTRPFLLLGSKPTPQTEQIKEDDGHLSGGKFRCRLDISGDTHYYARYWGDDSAELGVDWSAKNYASVVSGGGGASTSPTHTDLGEVKAQQLYPSKENSLRRINVRLFSPRHVLRGGNVWLLGIIVAVIIYLGSSFPPSHRRFTNSLLDSLPGVSAPHQVNLHNELASSYKTIKLSVLLLVSLCAIVCCSQYARWLFLRLTRTHDWANNEHKRLTRRSSKKKYTEDQLAEIKQIEALLDTIRDRKRPKIGTYNVSRLLAMTIVSPVGSIVLWALELSSPSNLAREYYPMKFLVYLFLVALSLYAIFNLSRERVRQFEKAISRRRLDVKMIVDVERSTVTPILEYLPFWTLLVFTGFGNLIIVFWEVRNEGRFGALTPFGGSVLLLISVIVGAAAALAAIYYSKWLFEQAYRVKVTLWSYIPVMALSAVAVFFPATSIGLIGTKEMRLIGADILFLATIPALIAGCVALAVAVGNKVKRWSRRLVFLALGLWHALLQLAVPFLLVALGSNQALIVAAGTVVGVSLIFYLAIKLLPLTYVELLLSRPVLVPLWLAYGLWMLALPIIFPRMPASGLWIPGSYSAGTVLIASAVTGLVGAIMSCVWLGWYFALGLAFGGHSNEAGSTARLEEFKHFIRFRITEKSLTGYVIGIDRPQESWRDLKPRLVDVFTLTCD